MARVAFLYFKFVCVHMQRCMQQTLFFLFLFLFSPPHIFCSSNLKFRRRLQKSQNKQRSSSLPASVGCNAFVFRYIYAVNALTLFSDSSGRLLNFRDFYVYFDFRIYLFEIYLPACFTGVKLLSALLVCYEFICGVLLVIYNVYIWFIVCRVCVPKSLKLLTIISRTLRFSIPKNAHTYAFHIQHTHTDVHTQAYFHTHKAG